jgi:solute carrier family 25 carnitine/acylcarnitine transporter 20/29
LLHWEATFAMAEAVATQPSWPRQLGIALISGSAGGLAAVAAGHPFETAKVRLQMGEPLGWKLLRKPYSGGLAAAIGVTPYWVAGYTGYRAGSLLGFDDNSGASILVRGVLSGLCDTIARTPVDNVKTNAQHRGWSSSRTLAHMWRREGIASLTRGWSATAMWLVPSCTIFYGAFDHLSTHIESVAPALPFWARTALAGGLAGWVEYACCLPLDTLKTRYMAGGYASLGAVWRDVLAEPGGVRNLYRGMGPAMLRAFPSNAAALCMIRVVESKLIDRDDAAAAAAAAAEAY